jgi:hypothetical protein
MCSETCDGLFNNTVKLKKAFLAAVGQAFLFLSA